MGKEKDTPKAKAEGDKLPEERKGKQRKDEMKKSEKAIRMFLKQMQKEISCRRRINKEGSD